jgi:hypothetical protein
MKKSGAIVFAIILQAQADELIIFDAREVVQSTGGTAWMLVGF